MTGRDRHRRGPGRALGAIALLGAALVAAPGARAQWTSAPAPGVAARTDATARATDGASLRIWVDTERRLRAEFTLAPGLLRLDPRACPTLQIDDRPPETLSDPFHQCTSEGAAAQVVLAQGSQGKVDSPTLLALMNGGTLTVRYRLEHAGYGASRFSLKGSKQALINALDNLAVTGD